MTITDATRTQPWRSAHDRGTAMRLAAGEYARFADLLEQLEPEHWGMPTDCPAWDVRAMAGHVLGMTELMTSYVELVRQQLRTALRQRSVGGPMIDSLTAIQVEKNQGLDTAELVAAMRTAGPRAVRGRRRMPAIMRSRTMKQDTPDGRTEVWTLGFLTDTILTRDPFMHRIDITRATGLPLTPTPEHEGEVVADVVQEWAARHGRPFRLELTGPAGGSWQQGEGESITMDALEFCRVLSGRDHGEGLLSIQVPF